MILLSIPLWPRRGALESDAVEDAERTTAAAGKRDHVRTLLQEARAVAPQVSHGFALVDRRDTLPADEAVRGGKVAELAVLSRAHRRAVVGIIPEVTRLVVPLPEQQHVSRIGEGG